MTCHECGHARKDHCCCGAVCMKKCKCSRYADEKGLAPCPTCDKNDKLVRVEWSEGDKQRATYRCVRCHPIEAKSEFSSERGRRAAAAFKKALATLAQGGQR